MFKKIILILVLICMMVTSAFALTGTYTNNGYFYLPAYESYGLAEYNEYNRLMQIADTQIEANRSTITDEGIQDIAGDMFSDNMETFIDLVYQDEDGTIDAVVPVKDEDDMASDSDTHLATQQSIKKYVDDNVGGANTYLELTDTPAAYDNGKYVRSTAGGLIWDTPTGAGDMLKVTYDTDEDGDIDVSSGGTERSSWTQYAIPYLSNPTVFGEIPIGTAEYALTVNATEDGYDWTLFDLSLYYLKTTIDTQEEVEAIWGVSLANDADLALYYLKTEIDTLSEVETIYSKNITDSDELATALVDYYLKTAIDTLGEVEIIYSKDITDSTELATALTDYYLKTSIDTLSEVETIYTKNIIDSDELAALKFTDLDDTPASYNNGKYAKSTADGIIWDSPTGAGDMLKATYDTDADGDIEVSAGGTEKSSWTPYAIPYLSGATAFGEIPIGTDNYALTVNGATGYDWTLFDLSLYYLKTEIDELSEMETIWELDIITSTELATYCETTQDYLKTSENDDTADDLSDNDTDDLAEGSSNKYFPGFTSLFVDYAFTDNSSNWNTAYGWGDWSGEGFISDITGEDFADLADIPAHPAAATKILETTVDGYAWIDTPSGGGASELSDLSDVGVTTKTDKFVLVADGDSFESRALVEADISDLGTYLEDITGEASTDLSDTADLLYETELDDFSELQSQISDKTLINEEDEITFDIFPITPSAAPDADYEVANKKYVDDNAGDSKTNWVYPQDYATGTGTSGDPWMSDSINDAITACPAGGTVYCRPGYYAAASGETIALIQKSINLIGEGINKTFFIAATDMTGIYIGDGSYSYITLEGFTIDGTGQDKGETGGTWNGIDFTGTTHNYVTVRNVEIKECGLYGINCPNVSYSLFENLWLHDNGRHGIHPANDSGSVNVYNTFRNIYTYDNQVSGLSDPGADEDDIHLISSHNIWDNIHAWGNGAFGINISAQKDLTINNCTAFDNESGGFIINEITNLNMDNCVADHNDAIGIQIGNETLSCVNVNINNCISTRNDTYGIHIYYVDRLNMSNTMSYANNWTGLYLDTSSNINLVNVEAINNNCNDGANSGILIENTTNVRLTSCRATDDRTLKSTYIAFVDGGAGADTITTTKDSFLLAGFLAGEDITVTGSTFNDNTYTIVSVTKDTITLATGSLAQSEAAGDLVTIVAEKMQDYGLQTTGTTDNIEIVNCDFSGNLVNRINNGASASIIGTSLHALAVDHDYNGLFKTAPVGENVVFGQILYFDWTDTEWKIAKADAFGTTPGMRIALETKGDGATCLMLVRGEIWDASAFDFGAARIYLNDDTAGTCDDTAPAESGDMLQIVGIGISADILDFCPSIDVGEVK